MKKFTLILAIAMLLVSATAVFASGTTVTYVGNGFSHDGTTYNLNDERCGDTGQGTANDGGTGQFANWNGEGEPYETGQPYLVWVLSANGATSATLNLPDGKVDMIKVGGTFKYASQYYSRDDLVNFPVTAVYQGNVKGKVNLVVSHGCQPYDGEGAWCSPGYWRNASDASWALIGVSKTALFNATVVPGFYDTASAANPTLIQVLTTPGANTFGSASGPYGLNAFNATGAYLTDQLDGYEFSLAVMNDPYNEMKCPIDNHGNWKKGSIHNP